MRARTDCAVLFDGVPVNPFAPIGALAALARSVGQEPALKHRSERRPRARARAFPLTDASTMACFRSVSRGALARKAITVAIVLLTTSCSIDAVSAASVTENSAPISTDHADRYAAEIAEASRRFGIPESWIRAVMRVESSGRVRAVSPKGAIGLMQIMPDTWEGLRLRHGLGSDPYDPRDNILAGAAYLREMHDRYGPTGFLAAYNAGPGRYAEYLNSGRPLPAETLAYVAALAPLMGVEPVNRGVVITARPSTWNSSQLFAVVVDTTSSANRPQSDGRLRAHPATDLSGLEPSFGWRPNDRRSGATLFVVRASRGPWR
ncbi:MAG: lytic transglycosylase domain-containing protein [Rhodopseudomonas palustris]|nr:MAG: lytic transglycosylase domain-containing protein [Rhodopseudomonas palustris]